MQSIVIIFIISIIVRITNLLTLNLNAETYIQEDQYLYWHWSLEKAFTNESNINEALLLERMPGSFLFFQIALYLVGKNLLGILLIQAILDSVNCVLIALIAKIIKPSIFRLAGLLAAFSPLMIIISSLMLSDTLFLFFFLMFIYLFVSFVKKDKFISLIMAALFLGLSTYVRTISFPLILAGAFTLLAISTIRNQEITHFGIRNFFIFAIVSILPISERIYSNAKNYNSFGLTTQKGTHIVYWVLPAVLDFVNPEAEIKYVKDLDRIKKETFTTENPFTESNQLAKFGVQRLINIESKAIILAWAKGAMINILAPPFLLDSRIRSLEHPSFYQNKRDILSWLREISSNKEYSSYKKILIISFLTTLSFIILLAIGTIYFYKHDKLFFVLSFMLFLYFLFIVGPVYSPKYIHPLIPLIIIIESFAIEKIKRFFSGEKTYN